MTLALLWSFVYFGCSIFLAIKLIRLTSTHCTIRGCLWSYIFFYRSNTRIQRASLVVQMVEPICNAGDLGSIPRSGRFLGEGNGCPLKYSCLENPMSRVAWQAIYSSWGHKELDTTEWLSMHAHIQNNLIWQLLRGPEIKHVFHIVTFSVLNEEHFYLKVELVYISATQTPIRFNLL